MSDVSDGDLSRMPKNARECHPEEPKATKDPLYLFDSKNTEMLRFAQPNMAEEFFLRRVSPKLVPSNGTLFDLDRESPTGD